MQDEDFNLDEDLEQIDHLQADSDNDLYEHLNIIADKGVDLVRIDKFLMFYKANASRNKISQTCRAGNVTVNGKVVKQNYRVKPGDQVSVLMATPPRDTFLVAENIPINIVYEDDDLMVVDKAAGMVVHPGFGNWSGTLVNALMYHFQNLPNLNSDLDRPGLVHRIDKDTSGLLVIAKNEYAMSFLAKQFFNKTTKRIYWAFTWGNVKQDHGTIVGNLARNPRNRMQMMVFEDPEIGKHAVTHYKVLQRFKYLTWLECKLETGRTHQIRAHMKYIGHTLFNDERYEGHIVMRGENLPKYNKFIKNVFEVLPRHALHAHSLGFVHPTTKEEMYFESPMPQDMLTALEKWEQYLNSY
jgi:23S rRNA pseudouridine1911/1915/1917 synthase